ncbi:MAG: sulfite exporter TauE/SafE family protein [Woeseiaceae bacterium]
MSGRRAGHHESGRQLAWAQLEQQAALLGGRHVPDRRCRTQQKARKQGAYGEVSGGCTSSHDCHRSRSKEARVYVFRLIRGIRFLGAMYPSFRRFAQGRILFSRGRAHRNSDSRMPDPDTTFYIIVAGSFLAALVNAAFSAGGAMIILAVTSVVLPVTAIVPIHSTLLIGSTASRTVLFWPDIDWKIAGPFLAGSIVAVAIGARIYVELPETLIATAISIVMLIAIWLPEVRWRPKLRHPWVIVGFVHSLLSTLFAYGALLHAIILHTGLKKRQIVATMAASLTGMGLFKITGYTLNGFDYAPYIRTIVFAIGAAVLGTWIGKMVIDKISEQLFRTVFRALVTLTALRLLYVGLINPS